SPSFVSLRLRRPLTSTPFPYTTLFRSIGGDEDFRLGRVGQHASRRLPGQFAPQRFLRLALEHLEQFLGELHVSLVGISNGVNPQDRKSTRLNSSHLGISYAVFCLKKKK